MNNLIQLQKIPFLLNKLIEKEGIRLATENDLPYIEKTYTRSGYNQLLNRINQKQVIA